MKRLPDWHNRLVVYLNQVARTAFNPGEMDCALFIAGAVEAMTGVDLAVEFRGRYTTVLGGLRVAKKAGFADIPALVEGRFAEVSPAFAQVGDIAILQADGEIAFGIIQGEKIYVRHPEGMALVPLRLAERVFKV